MAPTLRAPSGTTAYVLARRLAHPYRSATIGDVVAFAHPNDATRTLIRRISALEGDELVDAVNARVYVVPKDHAWVTADADEDAATTRPTHEDSRTFGPVDARELAWRVMYSMRSAVDHAVVENSAAAGVADAPVLEAELADAMEALGFKGD
jgi:signal peptidase I